MELRDREVCSVELSSCLVDQAPADLASRRVNNEEKLRPLRQVADFSWNKTVMRAVGSRKLSAIT